MLKHVLLMGIVDYTGDMCMPFDSGLHRGWAQTKIYAGEPFHAIDRRHLADFAWSNTSMATRDKLSWIMYMTERLRWLNLVVFGWSSTSMPPTSGLPPQRLMLPFLSPACRPSNTKRHLQGREIEGRLLRGEQSTKDCGIHAT